MPDQVLKARVLVDGVPAEAGYLGLLGGLMPTAPFVDGNVSTTWGNAIRARAKAGENADISRLLGPSSGGIEFLAGSTVLDSAATVDLGTVQTLKVAIAGTATITSFGTAPHRVRFLRFMAAATLTHNAATLILPGAANIVAAAGDTAVATSDASGNWTVRHYQRTNGYPLVTPLVFSGNSGGAVVPAGATRYFTTANVSSAASQVYVTTGRRGRFRNLRVATPGVPGAGQTWTFALQKLFTDTALTCTISGAASNDAADFANSVLFEAGDRWCIKVVTSAGSNTTNYILFSLLFEAID